MKTFVMGDIHGAYRAMMQCFERAGFDYENDRLIQLGDIADGHHAVYECVEELLKIRHLIALKGNHDEWLREFIRTDFHPLHWNYGGVGTLISYLEHAGKKGRYRASGSGFKTALCAADIPETHKAFFARQLPYFIDDSNRCFVHAGFDRTQAFFAQRVENYYWDRELWAEALKLSQTKSETDWALPFHEIYLGHTPTTRFGAETPLEAFNIWNLDTGAGKSGRLTIMNIDNKQIWQSDSLETEALCTSPLG